jgi:phage shock protein PspC (stress-responsive transcriptional regulator)
MKKNISINISGIIFHIEEDGYERLKKYLDSINKYFSSFEDSAEILADIESRIAEIFLSKLNEGKQIITSDDVNALMATMGSVSDFKAAEEEEIIGDHAQRPSEEKGKSPHQKSDYSSYTAPKQLVRDQKRKILGGVCAGIAHYANIDPVWIRLLFALFTAAYGVTLLIYAILWVAMPGSFDLEEPEVNKKMFRDPETKALAGVSGGIAAYFGIDIVVVRVLFIVFTLAGGLGLLVYVVLWIILPEAHSITDRMQMQGEPVTLSNIESNIKKGLDFKEGEDENVFVKILLFPFRLIAFVITGLGKIIVPLIEVLRVAIGILITIFGFSLIFGVVIIIGAALGLHSFPSHWVPNHHDIAFPLETLQNLVPGWMILAGSLAGIIPSILIVLLGFSIIAKRGVITPPIGWTLFVIFFVSLVSLGFGIPQIAYKFTEEGDYKTEQIFDLDGKKAVLKLKEVGMDDYDVTDMTLRGYDGKDFKLVESYEARGTSRQNAIENARMVTYSVTQQDSILTFDSNLQFKDDAVFRDQHLKLYLYIPYGYPFVMDEGVSRFITQYVDYDFLDGYTWQMTPEGLVCNDCHGTPASVQQKNPDLIDFNGIDISGIFDVSIQGGDKYAVELIGPENEKSKYHVYRSGETLVIDYAGKRRFNFDISNIDIEEVRINITMPSLERLEAVGYGSIRLEDLLIKDIDIDLKGPIRARGEITAEDVTVSLNGNAEADLTGTAHSLSAEIKFASRLKAYNLKVDEATIEATGASSAKVNVTQTLEMEEGVASHIDFRGNPQVVHRN